MSDEKSTLEVLRRALSLKKVTPCQYESISLWKPQFARGVFGGQIIGQALVASSRTVPAEYTLHSMHSYFINRGDPGLTATYKVTKLRDGKSFSTRLVTAEQEGRTIFSLMASYHVNTEVPGPLQYQATMPNVPPPDHIPSRKQNYQALLNRNDLPEARRKAIERLYRQPFPIEMRFCEPGDMVAHHIQSSRARQRIWIKTSDRLSDEPRVHECVAAYFSDFSLIQTILLPLGLPNPDVQMMASLDHAMWFHAPFRADEWMLYDMDSPWAANNRGVVMGRLYRADGTLAVSVVQEGLCRLQGPAPARAAL